VLARIAATLAARSISVAAVQQREQALGAPVPLVFVTHEAREADVRAAIGEIDRHPSTLEPSRLIRIETV
jgi:homoserine dehydrogenase